MPRGPRAPRDPLALAMAAMGGEHHSRPGGPTTTEQGLGWEHQQVRAQLLRSTPDGWPCPACHLPMYPKTDPGSLDADHSQPRSLGGTRADRLMHASCNRRRGNGVTTGQGTGRGRGSRTSSTTTSSPAQPARAPLQGGGPAQPRPLGGSTRAW